MILAHINKNPAIHYLNKLEYFIRRIKKNIFSELLVFWKVFWFTVYVLSTC